MTYTPGSTAPMGTGAPLTCRANPATLRERLRVTAEPAIHVAHNLFIAGLVLHHCTKYTSEADGSQQAQSKRQ